MNVIEKLSFDNYCYQISEDSGLRYLRLKFLKAQFLLIIGDICGAYEIYIDLLTETQTLHIRKAKLRESKYVKELFYMFVSSINNINRINEIYDINDSDFINKYLPLCNYVCEDYMFLPQYCQIQNFITTNILDNKGLMDALKNRRDGFAYLLISSGKEDNPLYQRGVSFEGLDYSTLYRRIENKNGSSYLILSSLDGGSNEFGYEIPGIGETGNKKEDIMRLFVDTPSSYFMDYISARKLEHTDWRSYNSKWKNFKRKYPFMNGW